VLVRRARRRLMLSDKTLRLVSRQTEILPEYLELALRSPQCRAFIEENATGASSSMKNITQDTIRDIRLPVPQIDEQRRIMAQVSRQLNAAQPIVTAIAEQLAIIDAMPAALLRAAFQGQL
jgi:type I restriction enzyme, S subunit